ncbi:MAG TPA: 2,3-bisphosphoglycerate-independent phosphoglycerate mutase [candidate division Zixibacteria bacterium]|nr:2,3-bisphosphoglycerate-independent phosphoglycerate mutase [candidate division Zixibacteria bacterium]
MFLLCIMDGYGLRNDSSYNAIAAAKTPNLDRLFETCPHTAIDGSGLAAGLPEGQMGNSEVGHLNFGAGRIVYQEVTRIDKSISDGDFFTNEVFLEGMKKAVSNDSAVHLFGLVSDGCVHSSMNHIKALAGMAKENGVTKLYLHAFMDGRDTPPHSGAGYLKEIVKYFDEIGLGKVATVSGRYYGMDRDKRWERVEKSYQAIVNGIGERHNDPIRAVKDSYEKDITDEFILPVVIDTGDGDEGRLADNDIAIFFNFRADRVRQLSYILAGHDPEEFRHPDNPKIYLITMTQYTADLKEAHVAYPPVRLKNIFGEVVSKAGLKQLRIAETEKYAHVTYFFNGGREEPFKNEDRALIPSPKVATYDLQPEMSSAAVADETVKRILSKKYDLIVLNFANCDMVGHTGIFEAAVKAVEAVDAGVGKVIRAVEEVKGRAIITADHGNAEMMFDAETNGPHTAHTTNLVPCLFFDGTDGKNEKSKYRLKNGGVLADVAPTILQFLEIEQPAEMTGQSLMVSGDIPVVKH